jgi:hypothetical protein
MPSSTSSSSAEPTVSVVIGSNAPPEALESCLAALEPQRDGVDVLVYEGRPSPPALRERFPWARFEERSGALVPELWRDGIDDSGGEIVALTIAPMVPAPNWLETIRAQHESHDAVAGAIDPGRRLRLTDWAEYFCRYARDMRPFSPHECPDLPGDNATYKRGLLEERRELYRDGFWEPVVHPPLIRDGVVLWHSPELVVEQGRSAGWGAFVRQRLEHGRRYGHQRGVHFSRARNLAGVLGSPLVPFLMTLRVLRQVTAKRRFRLRALAALPLIFSFNLAWAVAEARGHLDVLAGRDGT